MLILQYSAVVLHSKQKSNSGEYGASRGWAPGISKKVMKIQIFIILMRGLSFRGQFLPTVLMSSVSVGIHGHLVPFGPFGLLSDFFYIIPVHLSLAFALCAFRLLSYFTDLDFAASEMKKRKEEKKEREKENLAS